MLVLASVLLLILSWSAPQAEHLFSHRDANTMSAAAFLVLGMLIVTRRPANLVGRITLAVGHLSGAYGLAAEYGIYTLGLGHDPVGGTYAAWVVEWIWSPLVVIAHPLPAWSVTISGRHLRRKEHG